jgi:thymidylate kinase
VIASTTSSCPATVGALRPGRSDMERLRGGGVIRVAGPDGSGKTTLTRELARTVFADGPVLLVHHRRGIGRLPARQSLGPTTEPHRHTPYPSLVALGKTAYLFFDFLVGWFATIRPLARSGAWVILQRDWWDLLVDPRRYRLRPIPRLGRFLGRLLPACDLTLVLEADADVILARKAELPAEELARQRAAWRDLFPPSPSCVYLDAAQPATEVLRCAAVAIAQGLSDQGGSRHAAGWVALPPGHEPRWWLPRGPRSVAKAGLNVYHPVTLKGRIGWEAARSMSSLGGFRVLPRVAAPPQAIREAAEPYIPTGGSLSVAGTNHAGRAVALIVAADGSSVAVAKIATHDEGRQALGREARNLERLRGLLSPPLSAPRILGRGDGVLVLEAVQWQARWQPWRMPEDVAFALGAFFRSGAGALADRYYFGLSHGDVAPWNLLKTSAGWVLIDWEDAQERQAPFYDLVHFLVQSHALLGRPSQRVLLRGLLENKSWIGAAVAAYARGAQMSADTVRPHLFTYLEESIERIDARAPDGRKGIRARRRLLKALTRSRPWVQPTSGVR